MVGWVVSEFVFCTGRYESGDWDSAATLPANLIDSIARYTEIATAPSGVIVPLSSERILDYPLVYLTGALGQQEQAAHNEHQIPAGDLFSQNREQGRRELDDQRDGEQQGDPHEHRKAKAKFYNG